MVKRGLEQPPDELAYGAPVSLTEVLGSGIRLDAAAYSLQARQAKAELAAGNFPLIPILKGDKEEDGLALSANNAFRFPRIYVASNFGVPFLSSSDVIALSPERDNYLSRKLTRRLEDLMVRPWDVLISCSGTVGNVALAPPSWTEFALSQHVIRLRSKDSDTAGYLACFLRSSWGRAQLVGQSYGSVVTHIEPHHLTKIVAPDLPPILKIEIGREFVVAAQERDKANEKLVFANEEIIARLKLPRLVSLPPGPVIASIRATDLSGRFDAGYHDPRARAIESALKASRYCVKQVSDPALRLAVRGVTKFRKRVYVERGGIPLVSSKQLFQVDPIDVKHLARGAHLDDLPEIELLENMLCITRSGTIGKVFLVPSYMNKWAGSEHLLRIVGDDPELMAYMLAWFACSYGQQLLIRERFGSVIQEIDRFQVAQLPIPWIDSRDGKAIAASVLAANELRTSAWHREQKALAQLKKVITDRVD